MRAIEIKAYQFSELSEEAKERAHDEYLSKGYPNDWSKENLDSWKKFLDIFPVKSYGNDWSNIQFTGEESVENLKGQRLATYIWNNYKTDLFKGKYYSLWSKIDQNPHYRENGSAPFGKLKTRRSKVMLQGENCVMTGYCMDDSILAPIYAFLKSPNENTNFMDLMEECANAWSEALEAESEWQASMAFFSEECEANEYEFTEDGEMI